LAIGISKVALKVLYIDPFGELGIHPKIFIITLKGGLHVGWATAWSESEFEILETNPELSDEVLAKKLANRTPGAIATVHSPIRLTVWGVI
jgi:hypothetical protein